MTNHDTNHRVLITEAASACLTEEQLQLARSESAKQGITLRDSIVRLGIVSETQLLMTIADNLGLKFLDVSINDIDVNALKTITANVASHYNIIPHKTIGNTIEIAICDPFNQDLKQEDQVIQT